MSKTAVPIPAFPWSLTKIAHRTTSLLAALAVAASAAAVSAEENTPLPFERALRRTVTIEGAESRRFELAARMAHYRVPGLSVAVIEDCRIVDARGFGSTMWDGPPVTPETRFQAGSISKSVTAIGALCVDSDAERWADRAGLRILRRPRLRRSVDAGHAGSKMSLLPSDGQRFMLSVAKEIGR